MNKEKIFDAAITLTAACISNNQIVNRDFVSTPQFIKNLAQDNFRLAVEIAGALSLPIDDN